MNNISEHSHYLLKSRYLKKNETGEITETPETLFKRVATAVAGAEYKWGGKEPALFWEGKFYECLASLSFLPNSPTLMNAGNQEQQLSACFVLPIYDSMQSIHDSFKNAKLIQSSGGGVGFNFSKISPKNNYAYSVCKHLSGPLSIIEDFDTLTEGIKHSGKRRGANMAILDINHPDIEAFIEAKMQSTTLNNFNLSIAITDKFMHAVEKNDEWELIHPNYRNVEKRVDAKFLWNKIIQSAWASGDPGLLFIDTINQHNPLKSVGNINATNPCGEVPLMPYESCNLGSINLVQFLKGNNGNQEINWRKLEEVVKIAVRFLDNVIEINTYPTPEIKSTTFKSRKIGLGVMGWADLLIELEIPYDSDKAVQLGEKLMQFISEKANDASIELAKERGNFLDWDKSIYAPNTPMRNATRTSIAPTGSISIIANTSSSIEPIFAIAYEQKHILEGYVFENVNQRFVETLKKHKLYFTDIMNKALKYGSIAFVTELPVAIKNLFKTAQEISPEWHLKHQLAFQKYTDNAVSKTINLPENATSQEVGAIFNSAYFWKAKGISIFRYNSKDKQVLNYGVSPDELNCNICKPSTNRTQIW
jgi:ribonucleoside-diphosphate reductase alpha chain